MALLKLQFGVRRAAVIVGLTHLTRLDSRLEF